MNEAEILAAVEAEFAVSGAATPPWPDPHPDGVEPGEDEYSRVSDPARYRIVGARVEAWLRALTGLELAAVSTADSPDRLWRGKAPSAGVLSRARRVRPHRSEAIALLVCTSGFEGVPDNGVLLGAGTPAVELALIPDCGCDACDSGSAHLLEELDDHVLDVVSGAFTHVSTPQGTVRGQRVGWSASGPWHSAEIDRVLADARAGRSAHPVVRGAAWW